MLSLLQKAQQYSYFRSSTQVYPNLSRMYAKINTKLPAAEGIFVQALPVFIPTNKGQFETHPSLNQKIEGKILLCKWNSGDFEGRYTGLIRRLNENEFRLVENKSLIDKEEFLRSAAKDLLPTSLQSLVKTMDLVGLLRFEDHPVYDEFVYMISLAAPHSSNSIINREPCSSGETLLADEMIRFDGHPCSWFSWANIPFSEMPADDELWYPKVLWEEKKVKGSFTFGGWSEKTIKSFELFTVEKIE